MKSQIVFFFVFSGTLIAALEICPKAWGAEQGRIVPVDIEQLPRTAERSESLLQFFRDRTKLGVGFDEVFDSNVFLQDNNPQEDYISTLEAQFVFIDPRGSFLYGLTHEINAFRYHRKDVNAINHDFLAFLDWDPGGRYQSRSDYKLITHNGLLLGPAEIDILRRNADFQRTVEHTWKTQFRYALNETNYLVPQVNYLLYDDQSRSDADTDRRRLVAIVDVDHDLKPEWTLFGGYEFDDVTIPGNKRKDSQGHSVRLGTRYELKEVSKLNALLKFQHREWESQQQRNTLSYILTWNYQLGPRTETTLAYADDRIPSFSADRLQFRSSRPSFKALYELTSLTKLNFSAEYEKQRSSGRDVLTGAAATATKSNRYGISAGLLWQFREKAHATLDYSFSRSKKNDYTNHTWIFGIETEL